MILKSKDFVWKNPHNFLQVIYINAVRRLKKLVKFINTKVDGDAVVLSN